MEQSNTTVVGNEETHRITPIHNNASMKRQWREKSNKPNKRPKNSQPSMESKNSIFPKLDQSDPVQARRIQQRRRMIAMGKNSVGYDNYMKQVPKHKRKPRSMKYPTTPDHTLDIPTKRWQGLVRAWRRALHQYDPPELLNVSDLNVVASPSVKPGNSQKQPLSVQECEIQAAVAKGLAVDISAPSPTATLDKHSPSSVFSDQSLPPENYGGMDMENISTIQNDILVENDDSDDDDDLL